MFNSPEKQIIEICLEKLSDSFKQEVSLIRKEYIGGGCINQALLLKCNVGNFFLKWNSSGENDMFIKEATALEEMHSVENSFLVIPKTIWAKEIDNNPGFLLMEYLQTATGSASMEENLGRGLAVLHKKTSDKYGFHHNNYCGSTPQDNQWNENWIDFFGKQRIKHLIKLIEQSRALSSNELNLYEKLINKLPSILTHQTIPSLIHGDLWSGNYMYTIKGPALIDPASYYADREMEMSIMTMFGGFSPRVWNAYQEMYPLEKGWQERNSLYQLYHILNHYYLFGGSYLMQANHIAKKFV